MMRGLTLIRPWSDAIVHGPKRVENRPWCPPRSMLGARIALHAGKKYATDLTAGSIPPSWIPRPPAETPQGIVGVARLVGFLDLREGNYGQQNWRMSEAHSAASLQTLEVLHTLDRDPWWCGPVGWLLDEVQALPEPIPCKGMLGLWTLPTDIEQRVLSQLSA